MEDIHVRAPHDQLAALDRVLHLATLIDDDMTRRLEALGLTEARVGVLWFVLRHPCTTPP